MSWIPIDVSTVKESERHHLTGVRLNKVVIETLQTQIELLTEYPTITEKWARVGGIRAILASIESICIRDLDDKEWRKPTTAKAIFSDNKKALDAIYWLESIVDGLIGLTREYVIRDDKLLLLDEDQYMQSLQLAIKSLVAEVRFP